MSVSPGRGAREMRAGRKVRASLPGPVRLAGAICCAAAAASLAFVAPGAGAQESVHEHLEANGCVSLNGAGACTAHPALDQPLSLTDSSSGRMVYASTGASSALIPLVRETQSGLLRPARAAQGSGCTSDGAVDGCQVTADFGGPRAVAVSPTEPLILVAAQADDAIHAMNLTEGIVGADDEIPFILFGTQHCLAADADVCSDAHGLNGPTDVAFESSGEFAYAASSFSRTVITVRIDDATLGETTISQPAGNAGCVAATDDFSGCKRVRGLEFPIAIATSPDGAHVYAASSSGAGGIDSIAVFSRNEETGELSQRVDDVGCVATPASLGCKPVQGLTGLGDIALSPDGKHLYAVASGSDAITAFERRASDGALSRVTSEGGCVSGQAGDGCAAARGLDQPSEIEFSPDGTFAYVASQLSDSVAVLRRDPDSGVLTQLNGPAGCLSESGSGECTQVAGLDGASAISVSPDGRDVYVASQVSDAVVALTHADRPGPNQGPGSGPDPDPEGQPEPLPQTEQTADTEAPETVIAGKRVRRLTTRSGLARRAGAIQLDGDRIKV